MPAGMEIDITAGSLDQLDKTLDRIADRLERIEGITGQIKGNVRDTKLPRGGGSGDSGSSGSSSGSGGKRSAEERFLGGPNQRLLEIESQKKRAEGLADSVRREAILKDLAQAEFRAKRSNILNQRRLEQGDEALNRKGLLELFGDLNTLLGAFKSGNPMAVASAVGRVQFLNTQDGLGGLNVEQKVGRTAMGGRLPVAQVISTASSAAGTEAEAAGGAVAGAGILPVAGLVVGLLLAAKAAQYFAQETQASAERMHQHAADVALSGGYEAARLRALGVDPSGLGGLRDRLASDGMTQFTAARYGIPYTLASQYSGDQNDAKLEMAVLNAIRQANREGGLNEARRVARIFGRESDLDKALVSDRVFNLAGRVGANGDMIDRRYSQSGRDFARQQELLGQQVDQLKDLALAPALHQLEMGLGGVNSILEHTIGTGGKFADAWDKATAALMQWDPFAGPLLRGLQGAGGAGHQTAQQAQQEHTDTNLDLIEVLKKLTATIRKTYGAGPYGDSLQPRGYGDNAKAKGDYYNNSGYYTPLG